MVLGSFGTTTSTVLSGNRISKCSTTISRYRIHQLLFACCALSLQVVPQCRLCIGAVNAFVGEKSIGIRTRSTRSPWRSFQNSQKKHDVADRSWSVLTPPSICYSSSVTARNAFRSSSSSYHSLATITVPMTIGSAAPLGFGPVATSLFPNSDMSSHIESTVSSTSNVLLGEVFGGLAHIALDLLTFFGPATIIVRSATVLGRMCSMAADYIPDQYMVPEELAFQILMLMVAWIGLVKSFMPIALAAVAVNISLRDGKAFNALFEPAGLTWSQFKALSVCAFDWISVSSNDIISSDEVEPRTDGKPNVVDDDYIYWLYRGEVDVQCCGRTLSTVIANSKDRAGQGLLGESRLLRRMESGRSRSAFTGNRKVGVNRIRSGCDAQDGRKCPVDQNSALLHPRTTIRAGPSGAVLLRIHTPNLKLLMDSDPQLTDSIRMLLFQGMQAKLSAHHELTTNASVAN